MGKDSGGINLVPLLFVEKKRRDSPLLLDFLRMRKFQNFDSEPWEPFFSNLCRWRRIRGEGRFVCNSNFVFLESEVLKEVVYIGIHGV